MKIRYVFILSLSTALFSCSKHDEVDPVKKIKSTAKQIVSFVFQAKENDAIEVDIIASVDEQSKTIQATVPYGTDISALKPAILVSDKASVIPTTASNFSVPVHYTVQAEDSSKAVYEASVFVAPSDANQMLSFVFEAENNDALEVDIKAIIDEASRSVSVTVPFGTDVTALLPLIEISTGATITPESAENFTNSVTYTVIAQSGTTADYLITVTIAPSDFKQMLSFVFEAENNTVLEEDIEASIDETNKTIKFIVPTGLDISNLYASIEVSQGASINNDGPQDFNNSISYIVTAEDGSAVTYEMNVLITQVQIQKDILLAIYYANPNNTLGWDLTDPKIGSWEGVTDRNGLVNNLFLGNKGIEVLPPEIKNLKYLDGFDLSGNSLVSIPPEVGNLIYLKFLMLSDNDLTSLPPEIGDMNGLIRLDLSGNNLTSLPTEIGNLHNLSSLRVVENNLTSIPNSMGGLVNLTYLDIIRNQLTSIPETLGKLKNLSGLFLTDNELTSIPPQIGKLTNLNYLYLKNNNFTTIPQEVCDLQNTGTEISVDEGVTCE